MSEKIPAPPATLDWLPPRVALRQRVIEAAVEVFEPAGFRQIVTPTFEDTRVFARTAGETSDVVQKEMYSFVDRGGRELTLRPEGTAPVVRAFLEHGLAREPLPARLWYLAPMFRYARAQRGRYREHWQFGCEAVGSGDPAVDAEIIALQARWYAELGLDGVELHLNSIGDERCRPGYRALLVEWLTRRESELSPESRERLRANPLRVLDSKDERDRAVVAEAPSIVESLCEECAEHLAGVRELLDARGVAYVIDPALVRGLDYYERTAWEFVAASQGAQAGTISGGGRYDGLAELLGGPRTPGVGFGCGVERLVLLLEEQGAVAPTRSTTWFCAIDEPAARPRLLALVDEARRRGVAAEADLAGRSLKGQLRHAERLGAPLVTVCDADGWARGIVRLGRDEIELGALVDELVRRTGG